MDKKNKFTAKFVDFSQDKLYRNLKPSQKTFIKTMGESYQLTFQELRQLTEMTTDFNMWGESTIEDQWNEAALGQITSNSQSKKIILKNIRNHWSTLKASPTQYGPTASTVKNPVRKMQNNLGENDVYGDCPVASDKTICCNLKTIDAIQGCGLGCSYCSIQTFYEDGAIGIEGNLKEKLDQVELDPNRNYHIGSGQSSDSLAMGNRNGVLDAQLNFARKHPNIILEFKTKTKNVDHFLKADIPSNVFVCWSLNPQVIIDHEEHFTASLEQRLHGARQLADKGIIVGFHFHPIVHYKGYEKDYEKIVDTILNIFSSEEIGMISLGTLTFIKPAIKNLRTLGISSKVLQIPLEDAAGKRSYSMTTKEEIFRTVYHAFRPWHKKVFFYFCMEDRKLWESVMGTCYKSNDEFEDALFTSVTAKMDAGSTKV